VRVQTDPYNTDVLVPTDPVLGFGLIVLGLVAVAVAVVASQVRWGTLSWRPAAIVRAVVDAASKRGEGVFWLVWVLLSLAAIFFLTGGLMVFAFVVD
jgi:hypothetical protein